MDFYFQGNDEIELDSVDKIKEMEVIANELDLSKTVDWIDKHWC